MSSKGHLAHRFKLQIRSQGELEARQRLENFDFWYNKNNLDSLLSERLAAKEKKKGKKIRASSCIQKAKLASKAGRQSPTSNEQYTFRAPIPQMHLWPTSVDDIEGFSHNSWEPDINCATPRGRRLLQDFNHQDHSEKFNVLINTPRRLISGMDESKTDEFGKLTEIAKLKGVLWPGMDLFDSATLEQKRMRNQRKGDEVLADMIYTSTQVEPAEVSYHPTGEFRASRDIFGPLSGDDSPVRDPTPKKRRSFRRVHTLRDVNTNAPRLRAPRSKKNQKETLSPEKQFVTGPSSNFIQPTPSLNPLAYSRDFQPTAEEEEFRLRLSEDLHGKKRCFSIFQDAPENSPGRTESPLEDHQFDDLAPSSSHIEDPFGDDKRFHEQGIDSYDSQVGILSSIVQTSPSSTSRQSRNFGGKENLQPDLQNNSHGQRTLSASHVYPPHLFYDPSLNPLCHHGYTRSYSCTSQNSYSKSKSPKYSEFTGDPRPINPLAGAHQSLLNEL
ncbi:hypothetical protein K3495_g4492 [Podosphaera aphanis]|nr:hypothetical protein K3495_g4492 [Podosphaera aphanis]